MTSQESELTCSAGNDLQRSPRSRLTLHQVLFLVCASCVLLPWVSPPLALTFGMGLALTLQNPFPVSSRQLSKRLLQVCVVFLGFGMNLAVVLQAGQQGAVFAAMTIGITLGLGAWLGKRLRIPAKASVLISVGTAICGGSAIAAVSTVISAAEQEISVAMGTIFLLNAAALYVFPLLGSALHLTPEQFGTWAGISIQDISSVVGAASHFGTTALETATAVKLSRALWIVPVSLRFAWLAQRQQQQEVDATQKVQIPWFIGLFLLASILRTLVPAIADWSPLLNDFSKTGMKLTLFLIGTGLSVQALKTVGWQPVAQGALLWAVITILPLTLILKLAF